MKRESPCVCVQTEKAKATSRRNRITKTTGRRRMCSLKHRRKLFISLLHSLRSSSSSKRIVILHTLTVWLYYGGLDNGRPEVAV